MASCHIECGVRPQNISSGKDIWTAVRSWEPVVSPNQENSDLLIDALDMEEERIQKEIREAYRGAAEKGFVSPYPHASMWIAIYFFDGEETKYFKFVVRTLAKVEITGNKITVGSSYYSGVVCRPVVIIQDLLSRTIVMTGFNDIILNPERQCITDKNNDGLRFFTGKKPLTMHAIQIAFFAFIAKYVDILNMNEVLAFIRTIRPFMIYEIFIVAGIVKYYDYGRTYKNGFFEKENAVKFARIHQDVEYIDDENLFRMLKKKFTIYNPEDEKFLQRVATSRVMSYTLC